SQILESVSQLADVRLLAFHGVENGVSGLPVPAIIQLHRTVDQVPPDALRHRALTPDLAAGARQCGHVPTTNVADCPAHRRATDATRAAKSSSSASRNRCAAAAKSARPPSRPVILEAHTAAAPHARSTACSIADPPGRPPPRRAVTSGNVTSAAASPQSR